MMLKVTGALLCSTLLLLHTRKSLEDRRKRELTARKPAVGSSCKSCVASPSDEVPVAKKDLVVEIQYCLRCKWGLRAAWMAQEILNTFEREVKSINLAPSMEGGTYKVVVYVDGETFVVYDRKVSGEFPQPKELKRLIRDAAFPDKELGRCLEGK